MTTTTISAGQSLVDVTVQECGSLAALFDVADAAGLTITEALTPGARLPVPASAGAAPEVAGYFAARAQRINTGAEVPATPTTTMRDYQPADFSNLDFL